MLPFLITGTVFGLTAGISPGPILTLVITETLRHNKKEGMKVALAPLITDIPIIAITLLILSRLANSDTVLGIISFLGGIFIAYLGYECIKTKGIEVDIQQIKPKSLKRGIIANVLNPHPYVFWLVVGSPLLFKAYDVSLFAALSFVIPFYIMLVGSKIIVALMVDKSRSFLKNRVFLWIMRLLGIALLIFAIIFVKDGLEFLNML